MSISDKAIAARGAPPKPEEAKADKVCPECGQRLSNPRNKSRHDLLFALLLPAFRHWPDRDKVDFQPVDTEDLRAWLLIEAGWCTSDEVKFAGGSKKQMIAGLSAFMSQKKPKPARKFESIDDGMRAFYPKSIAWNKCSEAEFKVVLENVISTIESIIGVPIEQLKREHENEC